MKSTKAESARNNQMNGIAASRDAGPLFPRLHVSETEKAGPRAPPRNKMALFEQFTVPSHRFVQPQPSSTSATLLNQTQQLDYRHSYFTHSTTACSQPSHGVSSCVTSSVSDTAGASGSQTSKKYSPSRLTTTEDGSSNLSSLLKEKAKVFSDDVLMQSSPKIHVKAQGALATTSVFENLCDKFASASGESAELTVTTATKNNLLEAMIIDREGVVCPMIENQGCLEQNKRTEVTDARLTKREALKFAADEQSHGCSNFTLKQSVDHDKVLAEDSSHSSKSDWKDGYREGQHSSPSENFLAASAVKLISQHSDSEKQNANASAEVFLKDKGDTTGDSQNNQIGSNEVSELSQHGTGRDIDDSPLSVPAVQGIRPKDVIRAVGQQHFWKARKALLRQQRIFSDQVFQLHKLIKVQHLLAETSSTLIDEEMLFGSVDDCAGSPSQCNTKPRESCHGEKAHVTSPVKVQGSKDQGKTGNEPQTLQHSQWYPAVRNDGMGSTIPYLPAFAPGAISAWGYPSLGMGHWMGASPAQGRPSAYQPFTSVFPEGAPFGGLYGPGLVSPMVPFCFPYTGQRSEPGEETSSNGAPPVATSSNVQGAPALGHVAHDVTGAWQFLQYNNPSYQRFHAGVPDKNGSIVSGASINDGRSGKLERTSGTAAILSEGSHAERLNNNGLENSIPQNENSSPRSSAYMLSTPSSKKAAPCFQKVEQPTERSKSSVFRAFSSSKQHEANGAVGRKEVHEVGLRLSKRHQSDQVPFSNEIAEELAGHPFGQSRDALDLFPLVPSLSSSDGKHSSKQTTAMWQGRVIKAVPHPAVAASQSAAGILLSLQRERQ